MHTSTKPISPAMAPVLTHKPRGADRWTNTFVVFDTALIDNINYKLVNLKQLFFYESIQPI